MVEFTNNSSEDFERDGGMLCANASSSTAVASAIDVVTPDEDFVVRLQAVRSGCQRTLGELLESLRRYLLMVAGESCKSAPFSQQNPSDLVQWTQLEAFRDFHQFRGTKRSELQAWVKQILIRNLIDARKAKQRVVAARRVEGTGFDALMFDLDELPGDNPSPSSSAAQNEQDERLHELLDKLPGRYGEIIVLHHFRKMTFVRIGEQWNCSPDAARGISTRALLLLAKKVRPLL